MSQLVTVDNKCSLSVGEVWNLIWSLNYQALFHYNRSPWVEREYASAISQVRPGTDGWTIQLVDVCPQAGALGYHEDLVASTAHSARGVNETPYAIVGTGTAREAGIDPAEVASHEMLEMLVDPYVGQTDQPRKVLNTVLKEWYIVEVGDPCQGRGYDVGAPQDQHCGVTVADFAYPSWWKLAQTRRFTSAAEEFQLAPHLAPFEIAPGGYMSVAPEAEPENWNQIYGSETKGPNRQ